MHHGRVMITENLGYVPDCFDFIQSAFYASIVNTLNFRKFSENAHMFIYDLPKKNLNFQCQICIKSTSNLGENLNEGRNNASPFNVKTPWNAYM